MGDDGFDTLIGRSGADGLVGGDGNDHLFDGADGFVDHLRGGAELDICIAGAEDVLEECEPL